MGCRGGLISRVYPGGYIAPVCRGGYSGAYIAPVYSGPYIGAAAGVPWTQ